MELELINKPATILFMIKTDVHVCEMLPVGAFGFEIELIRQKRRDFGKKTSRL